MPNLLANENSPYLRQHADNPVDWRPWGDDAFAEALRRDLPVLLSIGYSTCHWCHVMAHESFEDPEVAAALNSAFVCVKVDREELPEVDEAYMTACQLMTGSGGWPLTVVVTHERRPFFTATYLPPRRTGAQIGLIELAERMTQIWRDRRDIAIQSADRLTAMMSDPEMSAPGSLAPAAGEAELKETLTVCVEGGRQACAHAFDEAHGGFGRAPKFPAAMQLAFLLGGGPEDARMAIETLTAMRAGGIYDQLGGGFHRYSTDAAWHLPHFEKMLYDQGMLLYAYALGYERSSEPLFERTIREVAAYLAAEMTSPDGGFYSAQDADIDGHEGLHYTWSTAEMTGLLGEETAAASSLFSCSDSGNFRDEATGSATGANVLDLSSSLGVGGLSPSALESMLDTVSAQSIRSRLLEARSLRTRPHLDDKILTDWNGLAIAGLARAARALDHSAGDPSLTAMAVKAADHILAAARSEDGALTHTVQNRSSGRSIAGYLDDHAFLAWGLLELYEVTWDVRYLEQATALCEAMLDGFGPGEGGALYTTADDAPEVLVRSQRLNDSSIPSGNAIAASTMNRIGHMLGRPRFIDSAARLAAAAAPTICAHPSSSFSHLSLFRELWAPARSVTIASSDPGSWIQAVRSVADHGGTDIIVCSDAGSAESLVKLDPGSQGRFDKLGTGRAYLCTGTTCSSPMVDPEELHSALSQA